MKRLLLLSAGIILVASTALAQQRGTLLTAPAAPVLEAKQQTTETQSASMANLTPEMWLYMQELQRHDDPEMAVRRNAEERAAHRQDRLAARRWFGLSNARPTANPLPVMSTYSPYWAGQNSDPNRWDGVGGPVIINEEKDAYYER